VTGSKRAQIAVALSLTTGISLAMTATASASAIFGAATRTTIQSVISSTYTNTVSNAVYGIATPLQRQLWQTLGPDPVPAGETLSDLARVSGRVDSIAISGSTIYIGAAGGGVWSSKNGGASWTPLSDSATSLTIGSVAVDPINPKILYAGTGELHFAYDSNYGMGVLKSTDGGHSWRLLGKATFDGQQISKVIVDPSNDAIVYVASTNGIYKSTDSGQTWRRIFEPIAEPAAALEMSPSNPDVLYAGISLNGIYKTTNGGRTWTKLGGGLPTRHFGVMAIAIAPSDAQVIYISFAKDAAYKHDLLGLYVSKDGGATWKRQASTLPYFDLNYSYGSKPGDVGQGVYDNALAVDPHDPNLVVAGGVTLIASDNGGKTWVNLASPNSSHLAVALHPDQHALTFDAQGNLFVGNDGGVWEATASGVWKDLNTNLNITQFYPGLTQVNNGAIIAGGTQDNGSLEYNRGTGKVATPTKKQSASTLPAKSTALTAPTGPLLSLAHLNTWTQPESATWLNALARTWFIQSTNLAIGGESGGAVTSNTSSGTHVISGVAGTNRLAASEVGSAGTWTQIFQGDGGYTIIDPTNPRIVYTENIGSGDLFRSIDGGYFYSYITPNYVNSQAARQDGFVPFILVPNHPQELLAGADRVYVSEDSGKVWAPLSKEFYLQGRRGNDPVNAVVMAADNPNVIYAGTVFGQVFATYDHGATWTNISPHGQDPYASVTSIVINPSNDRQIYITYGGYQFPHTPAHVFTVDNRAGKRPTWSDVTGNLPDTPVNAALLIGSHLYVGTDQGVYQTQAGHTNWQLFGLGMPNTPVVSLIRTESGLLIAGTHGRGVWESAAPALGSGPSPQYYEWNTRSPLR